jgi:pimeloyl-ACP methyl ester carboxylesterase
MTVTGQGEALVFVHGTGASARRWQRVSDAFATSRQVIEYDRRGRGGSDDGTQYGLDDETGDLLAVLEAVGHGNSVDVVAHSYGALIAVAALSAGATCFRRLVLYEAPLATPGQCEFIDLEQVTALETERVEQGDEAATKFFLRQFPRATEQDIAEMQSTPLWQGRIAAAHTLARELRVAQAFVVNTDQLQQCQIPILIVVGGDSVEPFHISAQSLHKYLPGSVLCEIPGQRHRAMDTVPDFMFNQISQFLEAV